MGIANDDWFDPWGYVLAVVLGIVITIWLVFG